MFWCLDHRDGQEMWSVGVTKKAKKERKESRRCGTAYLPRPPTKSYCHHICHVGWGLGHNHMFQVSLKLVHGFWLYEESEFTVFLYLALWLIWHVGATAQPVIWWRLQPFRTMPNFLQLKTRSFLQSHGRLGPFWSFIYCACTEMATFLHPG